MTLECKASSGNEPRSLVGIYWPTWGYENSPYGRKVVTGRFGLTERNWVRSPRYNLDFAMVDCEWSNSMHYWPQRLILEDWTTTRSFLPWFSSSVPTGLGGFLPINLLFFFFQGDLTSSPPIFQPTMVWPAIAWLATAWLTMVPTHDGSTSDGSAP